MKKIVLAAVAACAVATMGTSASAALYINPGDTSAYVSDWAIGSQYTNYAFSSFDLSFIGSWEVDDGPHWTTNPTAYSGLTAAALLFGGSASDYVISTVDNNSGNIDNLTWVSTWGGACGGSYPCGTKVAEDFVGGGGGIPEPSTWAMMILGAGLAGAALRRSRAATALAA